MMRLVKFGLVLVALGFAGLTAYAYLADLTPPAQEIRLPVTLDAG